MNIAPMLVINFLIHKSMEYDNVLKQEVLDSLENRLSSIAFCVQGLLKEGYESSQENRDILNITSILIEAYKNIDIFSKERQDKLDNIYNKLLTL